MEGLRDGNDLWVSMPLYGVVGHKPPANAWRKKTPDCCFEQDPSKDGR